MLGLISFLSTTVFFSPAINLLLLPLALYKVASRPKLLLLSGMQKLGLLVLFACSMASIAVFIIMPPQVGNFDKSLIGAFPYIPLILTALIVALTFEKVDLDAVAWLIIVEIFVGLAEYISGVPSFFTAAKGETGFGDTDLLYYNRVFGLSENSSAFAFKVMILAVYAWSVRESLGRVARFALPPIILLGLFISFNRTVIVSIAVSALVLNFWRWRFLLAFFAAILPVAIIYADRIIEQFSRGRGEGDYSGRDTIFVEFSRVVMDSPLAGNSGAKVWLYFNDKLYHAHNSYLELMASVGVPMFLIFLCGYALLFLRAWRVVLPVAIYSLFQYGLFWGLVFHDIVTAAIFFASCKVMSDKETPCSPVAPAAFTVNPCKGRAT